MEELLCEVDGGNPMKVVRYSDRDFDICQTLQIDMHARMRAGQPL